jgi:hypothetical protein
MIDALYIAAFVGLGIGIVFSLIFGIYSKSTATSYARSIFGLDSTTAITYGVIGLVVASVVFLATVSALVRDLAYPNAHPWLFSTEVFLMAIPPAIVFLMMAKFRGYPITTTTWEEFAILAGKFGLLHVFLQFSGFYSNVFPPK